MKRRSDAVVSTMLRAFFLILCFSVAIGAYGMQVTFSVGDVKLIRGSSTMNVDERTAIKSGDTITTGKRSLVSLAYNDGSKLEVRENSRIIVGNEKVDNSELVSVVSGVVNGKFRKLTKEADRKLYTPTTVCSIRGTEFTIGVSDSADSRVNLEEGKLDVRNPYGRIDLAEGERADVAVAGRPGKDSAEGTVEQWQSKENANFESNPGPQSGRFQDYMGTFSKNNTKNSGKINAFSRNASRVSRDEKALERANGEIAAMEGTVQDELFLNRAANASLNGIVSRFSDTKGDMYNTFERIKKDSDKIADQQARNYAALMAVKEAYQKAYEAIKGRHQSEVERMREMLKSQKGEKKQ